MSLRIVIFCALCLMALSIASAESVSLPLATVKKPAADLIDSSGRALDVGRAAQLTKKGQDLSLLDPQDNKFWQNKSYPSVGKGEVPYPQGVNGVVFQNDEAQLPFTYMARVQSAENPNQFYRLTVSRFTHTALMRAAMLRKLGYYIASPRYYKDLKVRFANEAQKEKFLATSQESLISDYESRGWISEDNKTEHTITFTDAVLEPMSNEFFDIQWGYAPNPKNPAQLATVERLSKYRAYRSLILPYAFVDVPESINRFSPKFAAVLSGHVVITHPSAESFAAATYEDVRWLLRKMSLWTVQDYRDIVEAGEFPQELEEIVYRKLLYRAGNAFEIFNLPSNLPQTLPSLEYTSPTGLVKNGKVTQELVPGYPQRFAHGDRESPFKDGDLARYFDVQGRSMALGTALNQVNKQLQLLTMAQAVDSRKSEISQRILNHIRTNPNQPLYQPVEAWGGPLFGLNVAAARHVTTGTYYGSSAAIQLVDNISIASNLGYFWAIDGVPKVTPFVGGNLQVMRDYTHVRPVLSITEGTQVKWKDLAVPFKMNALAKILNKEKVQREGFPDQHPVDAFLLELREGEVFTITDSIALSTYAQVSSSLDVLMGISPLSFVNTVSGGSDASRVTLRQTSFMKMNGGIQIYIREQNSNAFGLQFDVNFFLNLMRVRASTTYSKLHTDAFVIDYDPALSEYLDPNADNEYAKKYFKTRNDIKPTLWALFSDNETELLYSRFKYQQFALDHKLKTKELRTKFLLWKTNGLNEEHTVKIQYPRSEEAPELNPADEAVTLFASRRGELKGRDFLGAAFDLLEGLFNKKAPDAQIDLARLSDPNPANTPFGNAYWRMVTAEGDLTPGSGAYPNVATLQHVWGGWNLNAKEFRQLLEDIQKEFKDSPVAPYRLIEPEFFSNTRAIDFYRITAQLSVLPGGIDRIRDLITQPLATGKPVKRASALGGIFQKLSEKLGKKARANDMEMYKEMMKILGNGDYAKGHARYLQQCQENQAKALGSESSNSVATGAWQDGTFYECLDHWVKRLLTLSRKFPADRQGQVRWVSEVLYILDEQLPLPQLLRFLGEENYVFLIRINGFRAGDEDGDLEYFSNTLGDPKENLEYANGLMQMYANKTRVSPIEIIRTQGGFR